MSVHQNRSYVMRLGQIFSDSYWRDIFNRYDLDKDGLISYTELKFIIESSKNNFPEDKVAEIMALADRNSSGNLDFEEFKALMQNPDFTHLFEHLMTKYVDLLIPPRESGTRTRFQPVSSDDREISLLQSSTPSKSVLGSSTPIGWIYTPCSSYKNRKYEEKYPCIFWPPILCMVLLSAVQIALFFYDFTRYEDDHYSDGPCARLLMYNRNKREQVWRYITYMLVHSSFMHLIGNVLIQLILGIPLGMRQRWWRVVVVYLAGVAAGSLAASVLEPGKNLAGASAGIYALYMAHNAILIMNWSEMTRPYIQLIVFLVLGVMDLAYTVYKYEADDSVSYTAHVAGAVAGLLIGICVLRNLKERKWEKRVWWAAANFYLLIMLAGILIHIFWPKHFVQT